MADEKKAPEAEAEGEEKKGGNLLLVIGIILGIVIIQTVVVYLIIPKPTNEEEELRKAQMDSIRAAEKAEKTMGDVTVDAPITAIVNIDVGSDDERILKVVIALEYDGKNLKLGDELRRRTPRYNDMLIRHLRGLTTKEIAEVGIQDKIGKEMLRMINNELPPVGDKEYMGEVLRIVFREFVVQ